MLASAYDYDIAGEEDPSHAAESYAYLTRTEQGHDYEDDQETTTPREGDPDIAVAEFDENPYISNACSVSFEYSDTPNIPEPEHQRQRQSSPSKENS